MRIQLLFVVALTGLSTWAIQAQEPRAPRNVDNIPVSPSPQMGTPRDWNDPYRLESGRAYLQRRAQEQTAAREARIEGMRWLGYSPLRPTTSSTPFPTTWGSTWGTHYYGWHYNTLPYWYHVGTFAGPPVP